MLKYLLTHPQYLRYWLASVCSDLGYYTRNVLLLFLVYGMTHSAGSVAVMLVCEYAPNILAPVVGVLTDRWHRKWTYVCANVGRAVSVIIVILLLPFHAAWIAYVGAVIGSVASMFAQGSSYAFLQEFVPTEDRRTTSALRQMVYSAMMLIGPAIGTGLDSLVGLTSALAFSSACYIAAGLFLSTIPGKPNAIARRTKKLTFWDDLTQGLAYAMRLRIARQLLVSGFANGLIGGIINVLEIFVITELLHLPKSMLPVLLAVQGISMLIAAPVFGRIKLPLEKLIVYSVVVIGLGQWVMVSVAWFPITLLGVLIEGMGISAFQISSMTLQQTKLDQAFQGRFTTANNMVITSVMSLTMLLVGWLHPIVGVRALLIMSGACACIIAFVLFVMGQPAAVKSADQTSDSASV